MWIREIRLIAKIRSEIVRHEMVYSEMVVLTAQHPMGRRYEQYLEVLLVQMARPKSNPAERLFFPR
jgi:sulfopyruvate decarboxylase TPP-binding subunit